MIEFKIDARMSELFVLSRLKFIRISSHRAFIQNTVLLWTEKSLYSTVYSGLFFSQVQSCMSALQQCTKIILIGQALKASVLWVVSSIN
jgi:hypothetical protein